MFPAIWPEPVEALATLRFISAVVADCSSTALAMVFWKSLICPMIAEISAIAATGQVAASEGCDRTGDLPQPPDDGVRDHERETDGQGETYGQHHEDGEPRAGGGNQPP